MTENLASPAAERSHWLARLSAPGSATHLALVRVVFSLHLLTVFTSPAIPRLRAIDPNPMRFARTAFPAALERLIDADAAEVLALAGVVACLALGLGLFTRLAAWVVFGVFLLTQNYWFRHSLVHDDWIYLTFELMVLAFSRCGDALSVDAWWAARRGRRPDRDPRTYRWPIELMILWFAVVYVAAGIAKITPLPKGLLWLSGATAQDFASWFVRDSPLFWMLGEAPFDYRIRWPFTLASVATVVVELGAAAVLFSRRAYLPVLIAVGAMHATIWLLGIPFFVRIFLTQVVLFLPPERLRRFDPARRGGDQETSSVCLRS